MKQPPCMMSSSEVIEIWKVSMPLGITIFPDFDSLKIPFFLRSDNQYIVKSADFLG